MKGHFLRHKHKPEETVVEPAPLSVRFSAGILDIGIIIIFIGGVSVLWRLAMGDDLSGMRYKPPSSDDALPRLLKSIGIYGVLGVYYAAWLSSPLQATPGMLPVNTQVHRGDGRRIGFVRAMVWFWVAFLPLMMANYLILGGFVVGEPLLHVGQLNIFSLLILLQVIWFLMILSSPDRRSVHDMICGVRVDHTTRPFSHPVLKHIAFLPLSGVAIVVLSAVLVVSSINLFDVPLKDKIAGYEERIPENNNRLLAHWRDESAFEIDREDVFDFSCAAHDKRFFRDGDCPKSSRMHDILGKYAPLINAYEQDFQTASVRGDALDKYKFQESIKLTDLVLAGFMLNFRKADEDSRKDLYDKWIVLAQKWDELLRKPDYLNIKSGISVQYNHVLLIWPMMLDIEPSLLSYKKDRLQDLLKVIDFNQGFIDALVSYQYALFNNSLRITRIDYFPLIQPNYIRNQFARRAELLEDALVSYSDPDREVDIGAYEQAKAGIWDPMTKESFGLRLLKTIYNPLGRAIFNIVDTPNPLRYISITSFTLNNSLKRMLKVLVMIKEQNIKDDQINVFLKELPEELRYPLGDQKLRFDPRSHVLYHSSPRFPGVRRIVPF